LYDDGKEDPSAITRDYVLLLDEQGPPLLSVFGGKITTYRKLAEQVMDKLTRWIPAHRPWTHAEALPGGDFGGRDYPAVLAEFRERYRGLDPHWLARLLRRHGTLSEKILDGAKTGPDLGENFGGGLCERELAYLIEYEWARAAEDVLWRRTKCGLHMSEAQRRRVAERMAGGR
jgi:glycerol-3-phosphate dehydrogenase